MADNMFFSRDTNFVVEIGSNRWAIPVLDGFSFSQATNTSEVTLNEMADANGNSRRGRKLFTDSYAPAEWSFSTYARPFKSAGGGTSGKDASGTANTHHAVEEVLWAMMAGNAAYSAFNFTGFTKNGTTDVDIAFTSSNKTTLGTANFYFQLGGDGEIATVYKITGCVVNEASVDFDIDGIATINWSGFGGMISEVAAFPAATVEEGQKHTDTSNFIRNRLTSLTMSTADDHLRATGESNDGDSDAENYSVTLTGGNVTISNNISFLIPETLGVVNQPLGHVTGTRSVSGSFTCYLNNATDGSMDLFERIIEDTDTITNSFNLLFKIGGGSAPRLQMAMPSCHLEVPTHSMEDIISLETNFHALGTDIQSADEISLKYVGS
jgi:hypothetical protein